MSRRAPALALAVALAGCNPKPTMAVGGVTVVSGLVITQLPDNCGDQLICFSNEDVGSAIAITGLLILGVGLIQYGLQPEPAAPITNAPPAPFAVTPPPPGLEGGAVALPAPPREVDPRPLPAYQLDYPSPGERQMAVQASAAARRGDCRSALASAKLLSVDTRQRLAIVDADFARCDR